MNILSKDILPLKTSQKFSSVLEPYAGKVASTVLRRECHCEVMFLSDNYLSDLKIKILDSANNERVIETASYFLGALDLNSSYKIKLNINGDTLDGEVINSEKLSEDILKEIENSEQKIVNKEENNEKEN